MLRVSIKQSVVMLNVTILIAIFAECLFKLNVAIQSKIFIAVMPNDVYA